MIFTTKGKEVEEALEYVKNFYKSERETLMARGQECFPKFEVLDSFPSLSQHPVSKWSLSNHNDWFKKNSYYSDNEFLENEDDIEKRKLEIEKSINQYVDHCRRIHDLNVPKIAKNLEIRSKIQSIMDAIGIPRSHSVSYFKSARSRCKTTETKPAGYLEDLNRNIKISQPDVPKMSDLLRLLETSRNSVLEKVREKKSKAEKQKRDAEKVLEIALFRAKYTPADALSTPREIIEEIISKNKYLRLGYFLLRNREDWNDGYDSARCGLDGFKVENEIDELIQEDIQKCIDSGDDGDIDGKVFRDTTWGYDAIFSLCEDRVLYDDLFKVKSFLEET